MVKSDMQRSSGLQPSRIRLRREVPRELPVRARTIAWLIVLGIVVEVSLLRLALAMFDGWLS